jgi:hypothetical protein
MAAYDRIEPETETHRIEKALRGLVAEARLPLAHGRVEIVVGNGVHESPAGQHLLVLLVHLLARMKGIVSHIVLVDAGETSRLPGVPLPAAGLLEGLGSLVDSLTGPASDYRTELIIGRPAVEPDVRLAVGPVADGMPDLVLGADAWRALLGRPAAYTRWTDQCPLGPYFAAVLGAAEVFKRLLRRNFGWDEGQLLDDLAFSLLNFGTGETAATGPDLTQLSLRDVAVAGAGAGGTAALYTLASFPHLTGDPAIVEPGNLKASNLGRYLMSDYAQVHSGLHKLASVRSFLVRYAPDLRPRLEPVPWHTVPRPWGTVICTVDTPEARWDVQRSRPKLTIEAGVMGLLYSVLRVLPGGWCLECKVPRDPDITWKRRALRWGLIVDEVRRRFAEGTPVTAEDLERLADVQGRPVEDFAPLLGKPFHEVPSLTECGETPLSLAVPSQAPVLPLVTTAAGIVIAAEVVKEVTGLGTPLHNVFDHDLRFAPRTQRHVFRPRRPDCAACDGAKA